MAAIVDLATLGKVVLYSLIAGVGISAAFALGVSSVASLVDALRRGRTVAGVVWGTSAAVCLVAVLGAIVLGLVVMSSKG